MVLVWVVGDALRAGDGEEVDEGLVWGEPVEEVTHVIGWGHATRSSNEGLAIKRGTAMMGTRDHTHP